MGEYTGSFGFFGGGLWTVAEDGSNIVERDAAMDGGSGSDVIGHHGMRAEGGDGYINLEWDKGGFVIDNGSMGSCSAGYGANTSCTEPTPGAHLTVYYKQQADGYPSIAGKTGAPGETTSVRNVFKNKLIVFHGDSSKGELLSLLSLPWTDLGAADTSVGGLSFGNNIVSLNSGKVYSVAEDGTTEDTGQSLVDPGYTWNNNYAWDWSAGFPPKFGIWEVQTNSNYAFNPASNAPFTASKVKVFKLASDGSVVLDKTMNAPLNPGAVNGGVILSFGLWGDYLVTGDSNTKTWVPTTGWIMHNDGPIYVWKGDQKVDTIILPTASIGMDSKAFVISKNGYVLINASWNAPRSVLVYLYKLNLTNSTVTSSPAGNGGGGTGSGSGGGSTIGSGGDCYSKYKDNIQLVDLCEQIEALKAQVCQKSPTISFCSSPQTQ